MKAGSMMMLAATRYAEDAAMICGCSTTHAVVKVNGRIIWNEDKDSPVYGSGSNSVDAVAIVMHRRMKEHHRQHLAKLGYELHDGKLVKVS